MSDVISTRIQKNPLQAYNSDTEDNNDPEDNKENANKRGKGKCYLFCTNYETLEEAQEKISLGCWRYVKTTKSKRKNSDWNSKMYYACNFVAKRSKPQCSSMIELMLHSCDTKASIYRTYSKG